MIIDEAQNLTPLPVKTIVTRVGHGTKIIFTTAILARSIIPVWIPPPTGSITS